MTETISTQGIPVRLTDHDHSVRQRMDTRFGLSSQEVGHVLVREPIAGQIGFEGEVEATTDTVPTEQGSIPTRGRGVRMPRPQRVSTHSNDRYILLRKYEGVVISRGERSFTARLFDNPGDYPVLEAEFDLEEISEEDRNRAIEGASLVWTIGYGYEGGTRKRESVLYLRRLPPVDGE